MGIDREPLRKREPARHETVSAIGTAIDERLDDKAVVRANPDFGRFVLDDAGKKGHYGRTLVELHRGGIIRFIESFDEVTPRHKPSVLVYDYETREGNLRLDAPDPDPSDDYGPLSLKRIEELANDCYPFGNRVMEEPAQQVLTAVKEMKIYIQ